MARRYTLNVPRPLELGRRLVDLLGPTGGAARQTLLALCFNSSTSFVAGATLGSIVGTFDRLPGLLLMVPAAIGLRGNVFGSMGNRLSTAIHTGTFRASFRRDSVLQQNVAASMSLTIILSFVLALLAKIAAITFGIRNSISVLDLALISVLGGLLASLVVLAATVVLAVLAVRRGWDLDNLVAPTTATLGDVVTIPALFLASRVVDGSTATTVLGWMTLAIATATLLASLRTKQPAIRQIVRESVPVLTAALILSTLAGLAVEKQLNLFAALPALLILEPAFVSSAGSLGGILSSRVATNLHLGLVEPLVRPGREVRRDAAAVALIGLPVFVFNGLGAHVVAGLLGVDSPGVVQMLLVSLVAGLAAVAFVLAVAYYGTIAAWRVDLDPDTFGIPVVTASVDFVGVIALIVTTVIFGLT
ncbi:MAG: magnesium transporter [Actinomycetes bacterium]